MPHASSWISLGRVGGAMVPRTSNEPRRCWRFPRRAFRHASGVLSMLGGDFLFESGEDLSIGYETHDADAVHLYLEESFSFRVATPEAAVELTD
jgi:hypothetical protein